MNVHISEPFAYPEKPMDRGKVLDADQVKALGGGWGRYKDVDGDGIGYRTLPGTRNPNAAYFTRGTGHNEYAAYSERSEDWEAQYWKELAANSTPPASWCPSPLWI